MCLSCSAFWWWVSSISVFNTVVRQWSRDTWLVHTTLNPTEFSVFLSTYAIESNARTIFLIFRFVCWRSLASFRIHGKAWHDHPNRLHRYMYAGAKVGVGTNTELFAFVLVSPSTFSESERGPCWRYAECTTDSWSSLICMCQVWLWVLRLGRLGL